MKIYRQMKESQRKPLNADLATLNPCVHTWLQLELEISVSPCMSHIGYQEPQNKFLLSKYCWQQELQHQQSNFSETVNKMKDWHHQVSYHGVTHNKDRQARVVGLHQVDMLQRVSDVNLEILNVHSFSFTLTMTNWWGKQDKKKMPAWGRQLYNTWNTWKVNLKTK